MRLQVEIMWVGVPTLNTSANGDKFYNQDVVANDLNSSDQFVLRVTSGPRANNISKFMLKKGDVVEVAGHFNVSRGKENRPFMQFSCNAVQRDRALWGTTGVGSTNNDFSQWPESYNYNQPAPQQQRPVQQATPQQPAVQPAQFAQQATQQQMASRFTTDNTDAFGNAVPF